MANAAQRFTLGLGNYGQPIVIQHWGTAFPAPFVGTRFCIAHILAGL